MTNTIQPASYTQPATDRNFCGRTGKGQDRSRLGAMWCGLAILLASGLSGCQAQNSSTMVSTAVPGAQPLQLTTQNLQSTSLTAPAPSPAIVLSAAEKTALRTAVNRFRINKKQKPGPAKTASADLDGDGKAEGLVLFTGEGWCAETGCTLAVFKMGPHGFEPVSSTKRVKAPVLLGVRRSDGWQNIHVKTGGTAFGTKTVTLHFSGGRYPGNAITQTPLPKDVTPPGQILINTPSPVFGSDGGAAGAGTTLGLVAPALKANPAQNQPQALSPQPRQKIGTP